MKRFCKVTCLVTALCLMLSGCSGFWTYLDEAYGNYLPTPASELEYTRPDMEEHERKLLNVCDIAMSASSVQAVVNGIYAYYDIYDSFYTNYNLAYIRYCQDITDPYWEEEYSFCAQNMATVDAGLETLFCTLADSPWREELETDEYYGADYFDYYEDGGTYDETLIRLMEEESAILNRYYDLCAQATEVEYYSEAYFNTYTEPMLEVYVELIAKRQEIAAWLGYDSYPQFAYDFYYYRDYTPQQAIDYTRQIGQEMADLYRQVNESGLWERYDTFCTENEVFAYTKSCAEAMGATIEEVFNTLARNDLYDIRYSEKKLDTSFEVYLDSYRMPFIFMCPYGSAYDKLTFTHEFGHFINDQVCQGSYAGTDVAEVHSQALEYLSLRYAEGGGELEVLKLADCLLVYVEQAAYALFEHQVYDLTGDQLTAQNVQALYTQILTDFGFTSWAWDSRDLIGMEHFFSNPLYIIGYVTSNDVAFQIYLKELAQPGAGLDIYKKCMYSEESYIVYFTETYGLESPFLEGRLSQVTKTLRDAFK